MAKKKLWKTPDLVPSIKCADLPRAIEWFERVFGFRERGEARLTWAGGGMTWMEAGSALFNLTTPDERSGESTSTPGLVMKVYVDNLSRHFARTKKQGATIVSELEEGFWGGKIYRALDLDGHLWEISQRGRDLAAENWELPPGITRGAAKQLR